jgi:hypothetical protein
MIQQLLDVFLFVAIPSYLACKFIKHKEIKNVKRNH